MTESPIALPPVRLLLVRVMVQILKFIRRSDGLEPEALKVLGEAYDLAVADLEDRDLISPIRDIIASRIMNAGMNGERDCDRLCRLALGGIGRVTPG